MKSSTQIVALMETPQQRTLRVLRKDRYESALENSSAALYLASVRLAHNPLVCSLEIFIQALQQQAMIFTQYQKPLEHMQLRLACVHRLEKEILRPQTTPEFIEFGETLLKSEQQAALLACHKVGNIEPLFQPVSNLIKRRERIQQQLLAK